jgi:deoxyribonuclease V
MYVCCDVHYGVSRVTTACVGFADWSSAAVAFERVFRSDGAAAPYESGSFYRRELPYLLDALDQLSAAPSTLLIDGYVWLAPGRPGLGAHLHAALGERIPVIGIAKRPFQGSDAVPVLRGGEPRAPSRDRSRHGLQRGSSTRRVDGGRLSAPYARKARRSTRPRWLAPPMCTTAKGTATTPALCSGHPPCSAVDGIY